MFIFWEIMNQVITPVFQEYDPIMQWTFYCPYCEDQFDITCLSIQKDSDILHHVVFGGDLVLI